MNTHEVPRMNTHEVPMMNTHEEKFVLVECAGDVSCAAMNKPLSCEVGFDAVTSFTKESKSCCRPGEIPYKCIEKPADEKNTKYDAVFSSCGFLGFGKTPATLNDIMRQ